MQSSSTDSHRRQSPIIAIFRVTAGNFLEQFDFFLFGFYATQIAAAFFPLHSEFASLISTFAVFGAGFLMRPLGAVFLGAYIDDVGRRKGLIMTLGLMASGTVLITFVPRYSTIGLLAPALVLIGRLLQGFAAGAELGGVSVYLAELASPGKKGFYTSWQSASQQLSIVVAASLGFALNRLMDAAAVAAWGWRIPFFVGCLVVPFVFMLRYKLEETEEFKRRETRPAMHDVIRTLAANWKVVVAGAMQVAMTTTSFYLITVYAPTFGKTALRLGTADSLLVTVYVGLSNFIWLPISGALSDRVGRRPLLLSTTVLALATAYPALSFLADAPTFGRMLAVLLWLSFLYSMYNGAMVVSLEEVMPPEVRVAGFSLAYSAATALFGGFTPAISTALIHATHDNAAPAWWLSFAAACAFFGTLALCRHKPASVNPSSARESRSVPRP